MIRRLLDHPRRRQAAAMIGGDPLQVLVLLACFALSGYAFYRASLGPLPVRMLVWFVAAVIGHDLVLYPLYALADRSRHLLTLAGRRRRHGEGHQPLVPAVNYLRIPTMLTALLLLVFWAGISQQGQDSLRFTSRLDDAGFLGRWLVITGVLYAVSAVLYAARLGRASRAQRAETRPRTSPPTTAPS